MSQINVYKNTNRIDWIDLAKGITILFVIIGHTACAQYQTIYSFHMALFAVLTGVTIHKSLTYRDVIKYIQKDLLHLILPFVVCLLLDDFFKVILWKVEPSMVFEHFLKSFIGYQADGNIFCIWFLPALFWAKLLWHLINKHCTFCAPLFFVLLYLGMKQSGLPFYLGKGMVLCFFIWCGSILRIYIKEFEKYFTWITIISVFVFAFMRANGVWMSPNDGIYEGGGIFCFGCNNRFIDSYLHLKSS